MRDGATRAFLQGCSDIRRSWWARPVIVCTGIVGGLVFLCILWYGLLLMEASKGPDPLTQFKALRVGMSEATVRSLVGSPSKEYTLENALLCCKGRKAA